MSIYGYRKIREQYGFTGLEIRFADGIDEYPGSETINIELRQIDDNGYSFELWKMIIPRTCICAMDLFEKLKTKYDGILTGLRVNGLYTEVIVKDKRYEALEWLESLALIHELTNK